MPWFVSLNQVLPWEGHGCPKMLGLGRVKTPGHSSCDRGRTDWRGRELPSDHHFPGKMVSSPDFTTASPYGLVPFLSGSVPLRSPSWNLEIGVGFRTWLNLGTQLCPRSIQKIVRCWHSHADTWLQRIINSECGAIWDVRKIRRFSWLSAE